MSSQNPEPSPPPLVMESLLLSELRDTGAPDRSLVSRCFEELRNLGICISDWEDIPLADPRTAAGVRDFLAAALQLRSPSFPYSKGSFAMSEVLELMGRGLSPEDALIGLAVAEEAGRVWPAGGAAGGSVNRRSLLSTIVRDLSTFQERVALLHLLHLVQRSGSKYAGLQLEDLVSLARGLSQRLGLAVYRRQPALAEYLSERRAFDVQAEAALSSRIGLSPAEEMNYGEAQPYDTVVVGAGFIGVITAYLLAKEGQRVLLVEKDDAVFNGSTGRNMAGWRTAHFVEEDCNFVGSSMRLLAALYPGRVQTLSYEQAEALANGDTSCLPDDYDPGAPHIRRTGYLYLHDERFRHEDERRFDEAVEFHRRLGFHSERLDLEQTIAKTAGTLSPKAGFVGGLFSKDCGTLDVFRFSMGYLRGFVSMAGAENLWRGTQLVGADVPAGGRTVDHLLLKRGDQLVKVRAQNLVLATGPYTGEAVKLVTGFDLPMWLEWNDVLITEENPDLHLFNPFIVNLHDQFFVRAHWEGARPTGRLGMVITRSRHAQDTGFRLRPAADSVDTVLGKYRQMFPPEGFAHALARKRGAPVGRAPGIEVLRCWSGWYDFSYDTKPLVGLVPGWNNVYIAAWPHHHGIMKGAGMAYILRSLIVGEDPGPVVGVPSSYYSPERLVNE